MLLRTVVRVSTCSCGACQFLLLAIVWSAKKCSPCFVVGWRATTQTTMKRECWLKKKSWGTRVVGGTNWGIRVWEPESGNPRGGGVGEPALRNQSWEPEFGSQSYWGTRVWGQSWWVRVVGGPEWRSARYTFPSEFVVHWLLVFKHGMAVIGCWDCHENCFEPKAWWPYQTCLHCVQCCQWFMFWDHQVQFYYLAVFGEESPIHVPRQSFMGGEGERRWGRG